MEAARTTEIARDLRERIDEHMRTSLGAIRQLHTEGRLKDTFRAYLVLFKSGEDRVISPEEMIKVATDEGDKILLTLHIWILQENEDFFSCCELVNTAGVQANWVVKVNPEAGEHDDWVDPSEPGGAIKEYFDKRNATFRQALTSGRAKAAAKDNNIDFDPGRWVSNNKASDHGAN